MIEGIVSYFSLRPAADSVLPNQNIRSSNLTLLDGKKALKPNFQHAIKKDKKGQNPASILLRVLYKHLVSLVEQNAVLVDEAMHKDFTFDNLIKYIGEQAKFKTDGSGIAIACKLINKALRGLNLIPKKTMDNEEVLTVKLI